MLLKATPNWKNHGKQSLPTLPPPTRWQGMEALWEEGYVSEMNFIGQCMLSFNSSDLYLFKMKLDLQKATFDGTSFGDGFFLEYDLLQINSAKSRWNRMTQNESIAYCEATDRWNTVRVSDIAQQETRRLFDSSPPTWGTSDPQWPTLNGTPGFFVSQFDLPDESIYLFGGKTDSGTSFCVLTQDALHQTVERHYDEE